MAVRGSTEASGPTRPPTLPFARQAQEILDVAVLVSALALAYLLRFDFTITADQLQRCLTQLPFVVLLQLVVLHLTRISSFVWRYISLSDLAAFARAAALTTAVLLALRYGLPDSLAAFRVPLSIILMDAVLAWAGLLSLRVLRRYLHERHEETPARPRQPTLLVGAGSSGLHVARAIQSHPSLALEPLGFVDDDPKKRGSIIGGHRVLGTIDDLPRLSRQHGLKQVVVTINRATRPEFLRILDTCRRAEVKPRIIPGLHEIVGGRIKISRIRDVQIEDLLGREPVAFDRTPLERLCGGRVVMVTGGGGSIGSELARQVAQLEPKVLVLVERSEFALFQIEQELKKAYPELTIRPALLDVTNRRLMRAVLAELEPEVVFHAAAHKHVPLVEENVSEALTNNVAATQNLAEQCGRHGVGTFVLISSDKAVRPTSVMGATKRLAEIVVQQIALRHRDTRYVAVRFGNVLGSTGSVIPVFRQQIEEGGPVRVTHPDMERYFMTIPEAAQLVMHSAVLAQSGEICFLDMGEPVRIVDLARDMIRLTGLEPGVNIEVVFTGIRPGEKLTEELLVGTTVTRKTAHPKIAVAEAPAPRNDESLRSIEELLSDAWTLPPDDVRLALRGLLPDCRIGEGQTADADATGATSELGDAVREVEEPQDVPHEVSV